MSELGRAGRYNTQQISQRQEAELIGLARGLIADDILSDPEIRFLQRWLAALDGAAAHPLIGILVRRLDETLRDGRVDEDERTALADTLQSLTANDFALGEILKATTLPLCDPAPSLTFASMRYCFTGTFTFGKRGVCEAVVAQRGAVCGVLSQKTNVLVVGEYATASWVQSSYGERSSRRPPGVPTAAPFRSCPSSTGAKR